MRQVLAAGPTGAPAKARFRRRDGSYVSLDVANATLAWQGRPAIQVVFRDVTDRDATERALRESEENFRALAENATDGVTIGDGQGRHVFVNRRAAEILGYPVEELLSMTFRDFLPPGE